MKKQLLFYLYFSHVVYVSPGTTYYARGSSSYKDYGENSFVKLPSSYDFPQTWTINKKG